MEIKAPVFKKELLDQLGNITVAQAENGEGLKIAKYVYKKAVKFGDDTTANEANHYIDMLKETEKIGSKIIRHYNE